MINEKQKPVSELLDDLSGKVNDYCATNYIRDIQKASGISQPIISALKRKRTESMSLQTMVQIANSVGYLVTDIKLEKIEGE